MKITRRQTLAGAAALGIAPRLMAAPSASLDAIGAAHGIRFGTAVGMGQFLDARYRGLIESECGVIVPENELKMHAIHPHGPDDFDFRNADTLVDYATRNGLKIRGHNLIWHHPEWMPKWSETFDYGPRPAERVAQILTRHVETVCRRYASRIYTWDVVNEAVDNKTGLMRETAFSRAMGSPEAVLDLAFRTARATVPNCELVYNDYMDWGSEAHRAGVLRLLKGFRERGVPVDTLGLQAHLSAKPDIARGGFGLDQENIWRGFLDAVTALGYKLQITELDVNDTAIPGDFGTRDAAVADITRAFLDCTLSYKQVSAVMVWGMTDRYSWLQHNKTKRADRLPLRCCPYDADFKPHPMRGAIAQALAGAPIRA
ncbi:endo-1,4-beta-xylanase [Sphingomonas crusticola]|uniref:endo-1,4-beta-xylanase n=1 Tax=Sphingomonas crusticola TaxID=1697973 RepID=UPI000E242B8E|nr:endo-1,4-beta-xylanase [Sphingomonas crusticola]